MDTFENNEQHNDPPRQPVFDMPEPTVSASQAPEEQPAPQPPVREAASAPTPPQDSRWHASIVQRFFQSRDSFLLSNFLPSTSTFCA